MVHYKLTYFPLRGAAETARQIFAIAGVEFEDVRLDRENWPALKESTPFGQLPVLEVDGKQLAQSLAISRYLAIEFGLNGQNAWDSAQVNAVADQFKDYYNEIRPYFAVLAGFGEGDLVKLREEVFVPAVKKHFTLFKKFLATSGSGYLVGNSLTWVDLISAQHVADVVSTDPSVFAEFPEFVEHQKRVHSNENLKKWIATRPVTPF